MKKKILKFILIFCCLIGIHCMMNTALDLQSNIPRVYAQSRKESNEKMIAYIIAEGNISWVDNDGVSHPYQYAKVEILNVFNDFVVASFYTDSDGYYREGWGLGDRVVYYRIYAQGENVSVVSPSDEVYVYETEKMTMKTGLEDPINPNYVDITIDMEATVGQAMQIAQAGIVATRYVKEMNGSYFVPVTIEYPHNENKAECFYRGAEDRIYICDVVNKAPSFLPPDTSGLQPYSSWDMIMHEYGHHVQKCLGITNSPGGSHNGQNLIQQLGKIDGIRLAWGEAYASIFGSLAQIYYKDELENIYAVGDSAYFAYNNVFVNFETLHSSLAAGEGGEFAIMSVLWDLFDGEDQGNTEEFDSVSMTHLEHWNMMKESHATTMSAFTNYYYGTHTNQEINQFAKILAIYGFSVENLTVEESALDYPPTFVWDSVLTATKNGVNYYHRHFCFLFYDKNFNEVYRSETLQLTMGLGIDVDGKCRYEFDKTTWETIQNLFGGHQYSVSLMSWHMDVIGDDNYVSPTGGYITPIIKLTFRQHLDPSYAVLSGSNAETFFIGALVSPITRYVFSTTDSVSCTINYETILENQSLQASDVDICKVQIVGLHRLTIDCYLYITVNGDSIQLEYTANNGIHEIDIMHLYNTYGVTSFTIIQSETNVLEELITEEINLFIQAKVEE